MMEDAMYHREAIRAIRMLKASGLNKETCQDLFELYADDIEDGDSVEHALELLHSSIQDTKAEIEENP
jgi:hypothetical protein